ncbi:LOG family protein [Sulfurimonas sp. C5]|uniref:LOG family protein n=1 Tax=Sulfurimonas sp. C5 TaxID=3036947 RepID=UPI002454A362|nr:LOG family protein [Sulfurimonas sp. C5]MDH4945403.1 LOG family protein [Sulfurimonas sp. C5]
MKSVKREKLPWEDPKSSEEEPKAKKLIEALQKSPTYQIAFEDKNFLNSNDTRGIRLELDYIKAELAIAEMGIEHTIVVFGSARIVEQKTAFEKFKETEKRLEESPEDRDLLRELYVAERMVGKSIYYEDARRFGRLVGSSGKTPGDCRITIMTGGGPGIMEAANRGSFDVGAKSIGLNILLPHEQFPNPYITPELCFKFHYFAVRKMHFLQRARALVIYPGGFGTFDELFETLTLIQTEKTDPIPVVLVGKSFWDRAINFEFLKEEGVISAEDMNSFAFVDNANEAWEYILNWYKEKGTPLI